MHHELAGPLLGNVVIIVIAGAITLACFVLMLRMLLKPGETDEMHPKYRILGDHGQHGHHGHHEELE